MPKNPATITSDEAHKLLNYLWGQVKDRPGNHRCLRNYTMTLLLLDTGLRISELCSLSYRDLIFQGVPVRAVTITKSRSKSKCERSIPLSERACSAIHLMMMSKNDEGLVEGNRPFFSGHSAHRSISTRQVENVIKTASKTSFGRAIHPHILRHTFATRLMKILDIRGVQELLGHQQLSSTQIYTHPDRNSLQTAIDTAAKIS